MRGVANVFSALLVLSATGSVTAGCGLITSDEDINGPSDREGGGSSGDHPLCDDGQLRLSPQACVDGGRRVQECRSEQWLDTGSCREPIDCAGQQARETGEQCGDYFFNQRLERCSGEIWQMAGCLCGSEDPVSDDGQPFLGHLTEQADVERLQGITFPEDLRTQAPVTGVGSILCAGVLAILFEPPELSHLVAALNLSGGDFSGLPQLKEVGFLTVSRDSEDLRGLESLEEIRYGLTISGTSTVSLDGLSALSRVGSISLSYAMALRSIEALSNITAIHGGLVINGRESLESLRGLHNVKTIEGDLKITFYDQEDFVNLGSLKSIGGNVAYSANSLPLRCAAVEFFSKIEIGGEMIGPGVLQEWEDCP